MKKKFLIICISCLALILVVGSAVYIDAERRSREYVSSVDAADCVLCGTPNDFRETEALGFVVVGKDRWDFDNVGMIQYCRDDDWAIDGCIYERIKDDALEGQELAHKNAPFDINGILKQELDGSFTRTKYFYDSEDRDTFSGTLNITSEHGLIAGSFGISRCKPADADYLCSVLCQTCFDKVYPVTREVNFFFVDCKTGDVISLYHAEEPRFQIRDYTFHVQLRDFRNLIFYATYSEPDGQ